MTQNLALWDSVKDPDLVNSGSTKATKKFTGKGGFKGTAVDPMVRLWMLTQLWGPEGLEYENGLGGAYPDAIPTGGWGFVVVEDKVIADKEHVIRVRLWYPHEGKMRFVEGYGCTDIEQLDCAKKSYTDAQSNAAKQLGVFASIYMGKFDDDKYVSDVTRKQSKKRQDPEQAPSAETTTVDDLLKDLSACKALEPEIAKAKFDHLVTYYRKMNKEDQDRLTGAFKDVKLHFGWVR